VTTTAAGYDHHHRLGCSSKPLLLPTGLSCSWQGWAGQLLEDHGLEEHGGWCIAPAQYSYSPSHVFPLSLGASWVLAGRFLQAGVLAQQKTIPRWNTIGSGGAHSAFAGSQPGWVLLGQWSQLPWEHRWPQQLFFFPLFSLAPPITPLLHPIGNRAGGNVSRGGARQFAPLTGAPPALVSATVCCPAPAPCGAGAAHGLATIGPMVTGSAQISLMPRSNLNMTTAPPSPAPTKSR